MSNRMVPRVAQAEGDDVGLVDDHGGCEYGDVDLEGVLSAMLGCGMLKWDALVALTQSGVSPRFLEDHVGFPSDLIRPHSDHREALRFWRDIAVECPGQANAALLSYFEGRTVKGILGLSNTPWLMTLPTGLSVRGDFYLDGCSRLVALPPDLKVSGVLDCSRCSGLMALPWDMQQVKSLQLYGCGNVWRLPAQLTIQDDLVLRDCAAIRRLPDGLDVGRNLDLQGCVSLTKLPAGMRVGGVMDMTGCDKWDGVIPTDARVGLEIRTPAHPNGLSLKGWRKRYPEGEQGGVL